MAWRSLKLLGIILATGFLGRAAQADDPGAQMQRMGLHPLLYGGVFDGGTGNRLVLALDQPSGQGKLHGQAMLLSANRQPIEAGAVEGTWKPDPVPGGHDCTLHIALGARKFTLDGVCSATVVSGRIQTEPTGASWLIQQIIWWGNPSNTGRGWLTREGFYS